MFTGRYRNPLLGSCDDVAVYDARMPYFCSQRPDIVKLLRIMPGGGAME